jgi:CBS domain containing-hemolysin-like protein
MLGLTLVGTNLMHVVTSELGLLFVIALLGASEPINKLIVEQLQIDPIMIATFTTTVLILIFGEILPKTIFRVKADELALRCAYPLRISEVVLGFIAHSVTYVTRFLVTILDKNAEPAPPDAVRAELRLLATMGEESGGLLSDQRRMIHSVLDFRTRTVEQVMVPLVDIIAIEKGTDIETFLQRASDSGFARIPVYEEQIYNIIGVVNLLDVIYANSDAQAVQPFVRTNIQFVPESKSISTLLREIQHSHHTMVFVVDEYGGIVGLVTIEDLVEEIVGEVSDERDEVQSIRLISPRILECEGRTEIDVLSDQFDMQIPLGQYETITGYILEKTGTIPEPDDKIETDSFRFTIADADARSIRRVRVHNKLGDFKLKRPAH